MSYKSDADEQSVRNLQNQIAELKRLVTNLTEAAALSRDKELGWGYALEGNRDGVWSWNAVTNEVFFSKRWKEMLGFSEGEISNHLSEWDKRVHPDDRDSVYTDLNAHLNSQTPYYENEHRLLCKDGYYKWVLDRGKVMSWTENGKPILVVGTHSDITLRKEIELENQRLVKELSEALANLKVLRGLLPICSSCKKIRDDKGYWNQLESYIRDHSEADFSHSICPECARKLYPTVMFCGKKNA
jgi:PAS domain S-box-containing protein